MEFHILKAAAMGVLGGWALFAFPVFILKSIIFLALLGFMLRSMMGRRPGHRRDRAYACRGHRWNRFHNMSDEEKSAFFEKMKNRRCKSHGKDDDGIVEPINK